MRVVMFPSSTVDVTDRIACGESVGENRLATRRNGIAAVVARLPRSDRRIRERYPTPWSVLDIDVVVLRLRVGEARVRSGQGVAHGGTPWGMVSFRKA